MVNKRAAGSSRTSLVHGKRRDIGGLYAVAGGGRICGGKLVTSLHEIGAIFRSPRTSTAQENLRV